MRKYLTIGLLVALSCQAPTENHQINKQTENQMTVFSLDDGNQDSLIYYAKINQKWLDSLKTKYSWDDFNEYDNRMWEYMYKLFDPVVEKSGAKDSQELWNNFTREQKVFWSFLAFNGDTDNGGVYQFFFNRPEHSIATLEAWQELKIEKLKDDYKIVLDELVGKTDKISDLKTKFKNRNLEWEKRWASFNEGRKELPSAEKIEEYYYSKEFKKELYKVVADYIEKNIDQFAMIEKN